MPVSKVIDANKVLEGAAVSVGGDGMVNVASLLTSGYPIVLDTASEIVPGRWLSGLWLAERSGPESVPTDVATSEAIGDAAAVEYDAVAGHQHVIYGISWSYTGVESGEGLLTIETDEGAVLYSKQIPLEAKGVEGEVGFELGFRASRGAEMKISLAGVAGSTAQLCAVGHRME